MSHLPSQKTASQRVLELGLFAVVIGLSLALPVYGQVTPEEHAKHHPGQAGAAMPAAGASPAGGADPAPAATTSSAGGMGGGMDMGKMMNDMGKAPPSELYPTLMGLPDVTPGQRKEMLRQATERMRSAVVLLSKGLDRLSEATENDNYAAMQDATAKMRGAIAGFESGVAAQRALAEGQPPRQVALQWFKSEMNLQPPQGVEERKGLFGVTPLHLFTMVLLVVFALAMVAMYYFKMRRAAASLWANRVRSGIASPRLGTAACRNSIATFSRHQRYVSMSKLTTKTTASHAKVAKAALPVDSQETAASPVAANWRGYLRVGTIVTETPNVKTFRLLPSSSDRFLPFTFVPGQFLNVAFWIGGARMNRSYSISSSPTHREYVELTVRREPRGAVSRHIVDLLKVGDLIEAGGPVGRFTFTGTEADSIVLISAGVGVTPMVSIIRYLTEQSWGGEIFFIFLCHNLADYMFANEIVALQLREPEAARRRHGV